MRFSDKHALRDKHLLRLERELNRLNKAQWNAPIIPLERPYQRGWFKTFELREDALHHPQVQIFKRILGAMNYRVYSRHPGFISRNGTPILLRPAIIGPRLWARLAWPFSHQRLFAYGQWRIEELYPLAQNHYQKNIRGFKLISTWWLEEKLYPQMITHQQVDLPEVRGRIAEIEAHLQARLGWERLRHLHGRRECWRANSAASALRRADKTFAEQLRLLKITPD